MEMPETDDKLTAEKWIKSSRLAQFLLEKSDLTREELKTMLL